MDYYLENADEVSIYGIEIEGYINGGWSFGVFLLLMEANLKKFEQHYPL